MMNHVLYLYADIPFFKQVVIMATVCDVCGKRDNEVKSGAGIEPQGTRITLRLTDPSDLSRDVLKVDFLLSFPCCCCFSSRTTQSATYLTEQKLLNAVQLLRRMYR